MSLKWTLMVQSERSMMIKENGPNHLLTLNNHPLEWASTFILFDHPFWNRLELIKIIKYGSLKVDFHFLINMAFRSAKVDGQSRNFKNETHVCWKRTVQTEISPKDWIKIEPGQLTFRTIHFFDRPFFKSTWIDRNHINWLILYDSFFKFEILFIIFFHLYNS